MATATSPDNVSRRGFLKTALTLTAGAAAGAAAAGGGLSRLASSNPTAVSFDLPTTAPGRLETTWQLGRETTELLDRLVAAQADNLRLRTELDAAQRRLATVEGRAQPAEAMEAMSLELADTQQRLGLLAGLVALYEQLESVDLDAAVDQGIGALGEALAGLVADLPTLREGLALGEAALADLEAEIPLLESGRLWLARHMERLGSFHDAASTALEEVADRIGSFLEMLEGWFQDVLRWLPFGMGRKAAAVMGALSAILAETPHTLDGLRVNVAGPLDLWLADEEGERRLERRLVGPMRQKALAPAAATADRAERVEAAWRQDLTEPATRAMASRRLLRELIAQYRETHDI